MCSSDLERAEEAVLAEPVKHPSGRVGRVKVGEGMALSSPPTQFVSAAEAVVREPAKERAEEAVLAEPVKHPSWRAGLHEQVTKPTRGARDAGELVIPDPAKKTMEEPMLPAPVKDPSGRAVLCERATNLTGRASAADEHPDPVEIAVVAVHRRPTSSRSSISHRGKAVRRRQARYGICSPYSVICPICL